MSLDRRAELGEFLRSRRARLSPKEVGLPEHGARRRVPGLRREELAMLAGVSVDHYVRLEQGRTMHFSESVLDAVAQALRLNPTEREHFYRLARPWSGAEPESEQRVRPGLRRLLDTAADVPAYIVGRGTNVLAWNALAAAIITDFGALPPRERNLARLVFLDEGMRELYEDWPAKAADVVAYLRLDSARNPGDAGIASLIEELSDRSPSSAPCGPDTNSRTRRTAATPTATRWSADSTSATKPCASQTIPTRRSSCTPPNPVPPPKPPCTY
ncbi:helix-turn-helix domain-containing protein [Nocardia arthritidis]|uniref:Helix-turn-helix domain-containing protein n=1 Tax=Nocardia arthritidis TaxID=228602 RepID=A0A6G9YCU3_9NOCA|nr:helix-turn-helix domain-containing protein [Nocardia arthritidis]